MCAYRVQEGVPQLLSLPNQRGQAAAGAQRLPFPPPQIRLLPTHVTCVNPHSISNLRISCSSCHQLVYISPLAQTKHFGFETHGVFLILENVIRYSLLVCFFFPFLFLRSTAISVFCPLPLILLAQSFKDPFHFFSGLGFQTSPDFFKDRVFIFVSFPPSCQGQFQEKIEKG